MSSFEVLKTQAESLGLQGEDLSKYVLHQQAVERDERAKERDKEREFQLAKLRAETELARVNSQISISSHEVGPKLPAYQESEDLNTYLVRFERVAELLQLKPTSYAVRLGSLLTGKAADLYTSLSSDITNDYGLLKKALLTGFSKTPDGYRLDFRGTKIQPGENYQQFSIRLGRLLQAWLEASDISETVDALKNFFVYDQFLSSLSPELRLFIKERRPDKLVEAARLADNWASARNFYPKSSSPNSKRKTFKPPSTSQSEATKIPVKTSSSTVHVLDKVPTLHTDEPASGTIAVVKDEPVDDQFPLSEAGDVSSCGKPFADSSLNWTQQVDVQELFYEFKDVFSDVPGCTSTTEHITLTTTDRIQSKMYPVPVHLKPYFEQEVDSLYQQGIIRLSSSPHCSPIVMVRKADGSYRMAIDYQSSSCSPVSIHQLSSSTLPPTAIRVDDGTYLNSRRQTATVIRPGNILCFLSWLVSYSLELPCGRGLALSSSY
ncbi:hypothetical protein Pcinc_008187 [Petrolisthes cinctipes]|uniref:SCAN box domain-containing protein n=1 Tax=Petrolisthes cinctipes TaxID=88211 RepID=A0AAE1G9S9_PETCI|nr:hypothetical protein Pcinc_008187 [Petrolisthes cinctipes]